MGCRRELLVEGDGYAVVGCSCGAYYLQLGEVSLRISGERFERLARDLSAVVAGPAVPAPQVHLLRPLAGPLESN